jgi:phosphoglycerol transferase MdoB-like AlkP superfamily enzyme
MVSPLSFGLAFRVIIPLSLFSWRGERKSTTKIKSPVPPLILLSSHPPLCRMVSPLSIGLAYMAIIPLPLFSWRGERTLR